MRTTRNMPSKRLLLTSRKRVLYKLGLVHRDDRMYSLGQDPIHVGEFFLDSVRDSNSIGVGLLLDVKDNARLAVEAGECVGLGHGVFHFGDVTDSHHVSRLVVDPSDKQSRVGNLLRVLVLAHGPDGIVPRAFFDGASGNVEIGVSHGGDNFIDPDSFGVKPVLIHRNRKLSLVAAGHVYGSDAVDFGEPVGNYVIGKDSHFFRSKRSGQADGQNRHSREIELEDPWLVRVLGQGRD